MPGVGGACCVPGAWGACGAWDPGVSGVRGVLGMPSVAWVLGVPGVTWMFRLIGVPGLLGVFFLGAGSILGKEIWGKTEN